ncbi:MAG: toll/interleukin-1 receptor domain-containing protein [Dehalococcoidia bacterium]
MIKDQGGPPNSFVSYSHDSPEHSERVRKLADRLRTEGVDCDIDQYHMAPPEGWPSWMDKSIRAADFVLVICSETYFRRVSGQEEKGIGLGVKWEGAIIGQTIYEAEGRNEKFLPVLFAATDLKYRPHFLRSTTYYDLGSADGYERLYRRLTRQPAVTPPDVGAIRRLDPKGSHPPQATNSKSQSRRPELDQLVLVSAGRAGLVVFRGLEIRSADVVELTLEPINVADTGLLSDLRRKPRQLVGFAFGTTAFLGEVRRVEQIVQDGKERWHLTVQAAESDYGSGIMEMGTSTYSADDFAEMRARRILLDEKLEETPVAGSSSIDRQFMDLLIRGQSTPVQVSQSPFPKLYSKLSGDPVFFTAVVRLVAVLWLRLSGVVEHISLLELKLEGDHLAVRFEGRRVRKYTNVDPTTIRVEGSCQLGS